MSDIVTAEDRCRGVLVGLAAGDKIGGPIRMAVRLAESLLDCGNFDPADILNRYLGWWREGAFDTGPVSARALALVAAAVPVHKATALVHQEFGGMTAGCNPAHRSPPLSMLATIADEDLAGCAMAEARLTHHDPLAGEVAAAATGLCRALVRGDGWDVALRQCGESAGLAGPCGSSERNRSASWASAHSIRSASTFGLRRRVPASHSSLSRFRKSTSGSPGPGRLRPSSGR